MSDDMAHRWKQIGWPFAVALAAAAATAIGFYALMRNGVLTPADNSSAATAVQAMKLQAQFAGPLKDTVVQRWQDPATGATCYIYLPITVQHSGVTPTGYVQYGANPIGSISCLPPR